VLGDILSARNGLIRYAAGFKAPYVRNEVRAFAWGTQLHPGGLRILRTLQQVLGRDGGQQRKDYIPEGPEGIEVRLGEGFIVYAVVFQLLQLTQGDQSTLAAEAVQPPEHY
jgi:hypothetical protein